MCIYIQYIHTHIYKLRIIIIVIPLLDYSGQNWCSYYTWYFFIKSLISIFVWLISTKHLMYERGAHVGIGEHPVGSCIFYDMNEDMKYINAIPPTPAGGVGWLDLRWCRADCKLHVRSQKGRIRLVGWIRCDGGPTVNCMLGHRKAESEMGLRRGLLLLCPVAFPCCHAPGSLSSFYYPVLNINEIIFLPA